MKQIWSWRSKDAFLIQNNADTQLFYVRNDGVICSGTAANSPYNLERSGRVMMVDSNGLVGYQPSTRESKTNINNLTDVSFLYKLNPVSFNYRKKDSETNEYTDELYDNTNYGFIADEVEKINKDLVFYKSDSVTLAGVEYNNMIAILTKAIQELSAKVDAQAARIEELENK